jgi:hypothetical protein
MQANVNISGDCVHMCRPSKRQECSGQDFMLSYIAVIGLCGSTGACLYIQLVAIPVGVAVCAAVHEGAG